MNEITTVFTVVISGADADHGNFASPFAVCSYTSIELARAELARCIVEHKPALDSRYDGEERELDSWEAYQTGNSASCFMRIEILESELHHDIKAFQ